MDELDPKEIMMKYISNLNEQIEESKAEREKYASQGLDPCGCPTLSIEPKFKIELYLTAKEIIKVMNSLTDGVKSK